MVRAMEVKVSVTDTDVFKNLIDYIKIVIWDSRMPGDLANEMQEKIGEIIKESDK